MTYVEVTKWDIKLEIAEKSHEVGQVRLFFSDNEGFPIVFV